MWDSMDTIPEEVLNGFKDQMDFYNQQIQTSLTEILSRLSTLEEKMQQEVTNLREQIGDLVTDRLVNAETMILEDISNFSKVMLSSLRKNCNIQDHAVSLTGKLAGMVNATVTEATTTCSSRTEEEVARVEEAAAKVEVAAARVEEEAARVEEATSRVEEMVAKMENVTHNNYSAISAEVCGTQPSTVFQPRDCSDIHWNQLEAPSGVYQTYPTLDLKAPVTAYCDMGSTGAKETGGWTVVLRRQNTSWDLEDFNRSWVEYREGFGRPGEGEWWFGLAPLHALTYRQPFEVQFILHDLELGTFLAAYTTFRVESEGNNYSLLISGFSGNVSYDALASMHHGEPFSTYDKDNDEITHGNCAVNNGGGWWYKRCHRATLTATFPTSLDRSARTIRWYRPGGWLVFDDVTMKIRPANYGQRFHAYGDGE